MSSMLVMRRYNTKEEATKSGAFNCFLRWMPRDPWGTRVALWFGWIRTRVADGKEIKG